MVTYPKEGDNHWKRWLIPRMYYVFRKVMTKAPALWEGPAVHQLVGKVMAYQGKDG